MRRFKEAEDLFRSSINAYPKFLGENHIRTFKAMVGLSILLREQGQYVEAEALAQESLQGLENYRQTHQDCAGDLLQQITDNKLVLATVLGDTGRYQESLEIQRAVNEDQYSRYGPNDPRTMHSMHDLAVTLGMNGDCEESKDLCQRVFKFSIDFMDRIILVVGTSNITSVWFMKGKEFIHRRKHTSKISSRGVWYLLNETTQRLSIVYDIWIPAWRSNKNLRSQTLTVDLLLKCSRRSTVQLRGFLIPQVQRFPSRLGTAKTTLETQ
jgi:tetratricopeptide (TPR) repeat protein